MLGFCRLGYAGNVAWKGEAEDNLVAPAKVFRDDRAEGGRVVVLNLPAGGEMFKASPVLPPGEYIVTAFLDAEPVDVLHDLAITLVANEQLRVVNAIHFDPTPAAGYQPMSLRVIHRGGPLAVRIQGAGASGFEGMRKAATEEEKQAVPDAPSEDRKMLGHDNAGEELALDLEEDAELSSLTALDQRVICDRVEIEAVSQPAALVTKVRLDKVHYAPGEKVQAAVELLGVEAGDYELQADLVTEIDAVEKVHTQAVDLKLGSSSEIRFEFTLDPTREFGHELRCTLLKDGKPVHTGREFFGVSRNVYRVGITGRGQNSSAGLTKDYIDELMLANRKVYANYMEFFAWAPCDYSEMTPDTESFHSGQTQYPGSKSSLKLLIETAHAHGLKAITYGKSCAAGIAGFETVRRHPEYFGHGAASGLYSDAFDTFYLDLMVDNRYTLKDGKGGASGWQSWASAWVKNDANSAVDLGAQEIIDSAKMFGWDGVRWDGHFVGNMPRLIERINRELPGFVHGYNVAFASPGSALFLPPGDETSRKDFHTIAENHGTMMDESVREWSHTNYSSGVMQPFYEALAREADYEKRIGGLPLFITLGMGSPQDITLGVLMGVAAGQRYTYMSSPADFAFGPLSRFMTRYSAVVWDDTKAIADAGKFVKITPASDRQPWFEQTCWVRSAPNGRQQLIVNLVNRPGYDAFSNRVQPPPATLRNLHITVATPADTQLARVIHCSPDLIDGSETLEIKDGGATLPALRLWSIVVFEYENVDGKSLTQPIFPVTDPIGAAKAYFAAQPAPAKPTEPPVSPFADYSREYNADADVAAKLTRPTEMRLHRNGVLDVHHARGVYAWLNPIRNAVALGGGGSYQSSTVNRAGFRLGPGGSMEGFPDDYESLLGCDVVVLDNVHSVDLGPTRRAMIADFVRSGGGLMVMGGIYNLSWGADRNSAIGEILPVEIKKYADIETIDAPLVASKNPVFESLGGEAIGQVLRVDRSTPRAGAEVLATVDGRPAIVGVTAGKGRVIVVLINPYGEFPEGATPYYRSPGWSRVLAACVRWLGAGSAEHSPAVPVTFKADPSKTDPLALMAEAAELNATQFSFKLRDALDNIADPDSARILLQTAMSSADKIDDPELLPKVVAAVSRFIDESSAKSFDSLVTELLASRDPQIRAVGYEVIGLSKNTDQLPAVRDGLADAEPTVVHAAMLAAAQIGDASLAPDIAALARKSGGQHQLLACAVALRLGQAGDLIDLACGEYIRQSELTLGLQSARKQVIEALYGGQAFKLTPSQRRRVEGELKRVTAEHRSAQQTLEYFEQTMPLISAGARARAAEYVSGSEDPAVVPLAYAIFVNLPSDETTALRPIVSQAKLGDVKLLGSD